MNAQLLGFFSGFPTRHFPVNIVERLRKELSVRDSLVFVSAWPSDYERNDNDSAGMHGMFEECNLAKRALDIWDSPVPYDGLGLADITIKAHITQENQELLQTLLQVSVEQNLPICAMEDESAIFVKEDSVTYTGKIHWVNQGKMHPLSLEILERLK